METITAEEMKAGTQPTRGEKIMFTPLEEVLAKSTWDDVDVEILVAHRAQLDAATLAKLGIVDIKPLSEDEVKAQTEEIKQANPVVEPEVTATEEVVGDAVVDVVEPEVTEPEAGEVTETATEETVVTSETATEPTVDKSDVE
jgi:hypothetical protein